MVTMVLKSHDVDIKTLHKWLNKNAPGWSVTVPERQTGSAFSIPDFSERSIEWLVESVSRANRIDPKVPPLRIHYKFKTQRDAMLAKLTWGDLKQWGRSPKKVQAIAKTDGDSE